MGRNHHIDKVKVDTVTPIAPVKKIEPVNFTPFLSHFSHHKNRDNDKEKFKIRRPAKRLSSEDLPDNLVSIEILPLIDNPESPDIFDLSAGKYGSRLMLIIKNMRYDRGVGNQSTPENQHETAKSYTDTYLQSHTHFDFPKGKKVCSKV